MLVAWSAREIGAATDLAGSEADWTERSPPAGWFGRFSLSSAPSGRAIGAGAASLRTADAEEILEAEGIETATGCGWAVGTTAAGESRWRSVCWKRPFRTERSSELSEGLGLLRLLLGFLGLLSLGLPREKDERMLSAEDSAAGRCGDGGCSAS